MSTLESIDFKLTPKDPGYRLISLLVERVHQLSRDGEVASLKDVCDMIGITPSHFTLLRNNGADPRKLSKDKIDAFARFLSMPSIAIRFLADQISIQDFYENSELVPFNKGVKNALDVVASDPTWGPLLPAEVYSSSKDMKLYIVRLYEAAMGTKLIAEGANLGDLICEEPTLSAGDD